MIDGLIRAAVYFAASAILLMLSVLFVGHEMGYIALAYMIIAFVILIVGLILTMLDI